MLRVSDRVGAIFAASVLLMATAACSAPAPSGGSTAPGGAPGSQAPSGQSQPPAQAALSMPSTTAPKYGGQIVLGQRDTPENMNILNGGRAIPVAFDHFYDSLVSVDQSVDFRVDFPIQPSLAEKWEQPDDKTWIFTIRQGVKWHDGTPLTPEGVVWALEHVRDTTQSYAARSQLNAVDTITAEGNTVKLRLKTPSPTLLQNIRSVYIVPKHIFDAGGKNALDGKSVGTGPFSLVNMDRTSRTEFKKFDGYWRKDKEGRQQPYLDGLQVIHNMDQSAQQAAFAARQIDIQLFSDKVQFDTFARTVKDLKSEKFQYASDPSLIINMNRPHLDKIEVRKALHLILNRQELNENFAGGEGIYSLPGVAAMKEGYSISQQELLQRPGWRANKAEDLAEAKRLLEQAGVPADWEMRIVNYSTYTQGPQTEIALNQYRKFGLKAAFASMDDSSVLREYRAGNFDLGLQLVANPDVTVAYNNFHSKGGANYMKLNDPEVDSVTEKLRATTDREEQKKLVRQLQERLLSQHYTLGLVAAPVYVAVQPWVNQYFHSRSIQPSIGDAAANLWVDVDLLPAARK